MRSCDWGRFGLLPHPGYPQYAGHLPVARDTIFGSLSRERSIVIGSVIGVKMGRLLILEIRLLGGMKCPSRRISRPGSGREDIKHVDRIS